jgi:hypothetical protein
MSNHDANPLDRTVLEDNRLEAIQARYTPSRTWDGDSIFGEVTIDPKLTRSKYKKLSGEEVSAFLSKLSEAVEQKRSLIILSKLPNSIRFPSKKVSEEKTLPEVILPGRPYPREIESGTRTRSDVYVRMTPAALERVVTDYGFIANVETGNFEIVDSVPENLRSPLELAQMEISDLKKRLGEVEGRLHPRGDAEADRRAALSPEERAKEDESARKAAAIRNGQG